MKLRILLASLLVAVNAYAANWYVRPSGGSGAGTSWTAAWNGASAIVWSSVSPGDTVWLAGGASLGAFSSLSKSGTAGNPITIKRVRSTDAVPVAASGWSSAFDSTVNLTGITLNSVNYLIFDGQIWGGIKITVASGYGVNANAVGTVNGVTQYAVCDNLKFLNVEIAGPNPSASFGGSADGFNYANTGFPLSNSQISNCWIHGWAEAIRMSSWNNVVVERCVVADVKTTVNEHADLVYGYPGVNVTFRYNTFTNSPEDGCFFSYGGGPYYFYGNVFINCINQNIQNFTGNGTYLWYIWNNVFYCPNATTQHGYVDLEATTDPRSEVKNNIFWNCNNASGNGGSVHSDHNAYYPSVVNGFSWPTGESGGLLMPGSPWVNAPLDFHLVAGASVINKGTTMTNGPASVDFDGDARGADGIADIGPDEYSSAAGVPPTIVTQPTSTSAAVGGSWQFTVVANGSATLAYQWYASSNANPGTIINGATSATLSSANAQTADTTNYTVTVINAYGATTSAPNAFLTVTNGSAPIPAVGPAVTFTPIPTNALATATVALTNNGTGTLTGNATISSPFSVTSGGSYSLAPGSGQLVTVQYGPTSQGLTAGTLAFTGGGGTNVAITGTAYLVFASNSIPMFSGLDLAPFTVVGANSVLQTVDNSATAQGSGEAIAGFYLDVAKTIYLTCTVEATNVGNNSFYVNIDQEPQTDQTQVWDITNILSAGLFSQPVSWRGNGDSLNPQFPTNAWSLGAGYHWISLRGREPNTRAAVMTVNASTPVVIVGQPGDATVAVGQPATFSVAVSGTPPVTYQWSKGGVNISGATSSSYTTPVLVNGDNGNTYAVAVSNPLGTVNSRTLTLTVAAPVVVGTMKATQLNTIGITFQ